MLDLVSGYNVYLACGNTDMRKSINGLAAMVEVEFSLNPYEKALFVFCNRQRNRIKILTWEDNGFWLHFKRLELGHFKWPKEGDSLTLSLTTEELTYLIKSPGVEQKIRGKQILKTC
jgi:transposase